MALNAGFVSSIISSAALHCNSPEYHYLLSSWVLFIMLTYSSARPFCSYDPKIISPPPSRGPFNRLNGPKGARRLLEEHRGKKHRCVLFASHKERHPECGVIGWLCSELHCWSRYTNQLFNQSSVAQVKHCCLSEGLHQVHLCSL